jgi:hypothetical protein
MNYPLDAHFKLLALASQISLTDARGTLVMYAKQKMFKLKEAVTVFADREQTRPLFKIAADRVLDISARYHITDPGGVEVAAIKRQGMRSFWRAHYEIEAGGRPAYTVREESAWTKVMDGLLGEIPILSFFTGFFFNPAYLVTHPDGRQVLRVAKQKAFFEGHFQIQQTGTDDVPDGVLVAILMMLLLERTRG